MATRKLFKMIWSHHVKKAIGGANKMVISVEGE